MTEAYKVLTHDWRPPLHGGDPICSADDLPYTLPVVELDESDRECGTGWNACRDGATALRIAGLWRNGRPARLLRCETDNSVIERGYKLRAASWTLVEEVELRPHVEELSRSFGEHSAEMVNAQLAWHTALGRTGRDEQAVENGIRVALDARGLSWSLKRYGAARDAWDAIDARDAIDAWDAWDARDARDAWDAWDAWAARAAWDALVWRYAALQGWVYGKADKYDVGIIDAHAAGLAVAVPVADGVLGWAMEETA